MENLDGHLNWIQRERKLVDWYHLLKAEANGGRLCKHDTESVGSVKCTEICDQLNKQCFLSTAPRSYRKFQRSSCASSLQTWHDMTERHLTATRVANEHCANVMRGGWRGALTESSHWSISHSLISHHRTAAIKQSIRGWWVVFGVLVWRAAEVDARHITLHSLVIIPTN